MSPFNARVRRVKRSYAVFSTASRLIVLVFLASLLGMATASTAQAETDCSGVFLPAFKCDGYQARPEGAFNPVGMPYLFEDPYITTGLNFRTSTTACWTAEPWEWPSTAVVLTCWRCKFVSR